jgi:hypothetical protein
LRIAAPAYTSPTAALLLKASTVCCHHGSCYGGSWLPTVSGIESSPSMITAVQGVARVIFLAGVFTFPVFLDIAGILAADGKIVLDGYLSVVSLRPAVVGPLFSSLAILPAFAGIYRCAYFGVAITMDISYVPSFPVISTSGDSGFSGRCSAFRSTVFPVVPASLRLLRSPQTKENLRSHAH